MEKITPFDIPLLNKEICHYLTLKDIARCVQVSKTWADWFSPALWRDLDCHVRLPYVYVHTLERQQEHVRIMRNITMRQAGSVLAQVPCTSLQRLEFMQDEGYKDVRRAQIPVLRSLKKIPTLRHLQIVVALDHDNTYRDLIRVLEALPHLESLSLKCDQFVCGKIIQQVLRSCRGLQCLSLKLLGVGTFVQEKDRREYRETKAAIETMPEMQLRELTFNTPLELCRDNIFLPLLERCPRVEKLDIGGLCGLNPEGNLVVLHLIQHHSRSLTKLDLHSISLPLFSNLMAGLPCLLAITVSTHGGGGKELDGIFLGKNWECLDLRCLRLSLCLWAYYHDGPFRESIMDHVSSEVAKLTRLQELSIRCNIGRLGIGSKRYLEQLSDLKDLEVLELINEQVGEQEAHWMAENWPRLLQVYEQKTPAIFRKTLLKRRPLVEFIEGNRYNSTVSDDWINWV